MRWQTVARVLVAGVGLGTAAAVYVLTRERPIVSRPPVSTTADPAAKFQSGEGTEIRHDGSRQIGRADYTSVRKYDDRVEWDAFKLTLADGAIVSAIKAIGKITASDREPAEFTLTGDVRFQDPDGSVLQGAAGTYNDTTGMAEVQGAASFTRGRMSGTGTGGTYERSTGTFKLLADAKVLTMGDDVSMPPIEATASAMTFVRTGRAMLFDQHAKITRASETMTANQATLYLSEDEQRFRLIELRGDSKVTPAPGKQSDLPEMQADNLELEFYDGGQALQRAALHRRATMVQVGEGGKRSIVAPEISFTTAPDGRTLTHLEASDKVSVSLPASADAAARTISASTLVANGDNTRGLTAALFEGGAEFVEAGKAAPGRQPAKRVGRSDRLTLVLKGQLDAIDAAAFDRNVTFTSGDVTGDADLGDYRAAKGELDLRPRPGAQGRRPRVTDGDVIVEAAEVITVNLDTNDLHATREVKTVSRPGKGAQPSGSAMFNDRDPLYGSATEFWYVSARHAFKYAGAAAAPAQLKQTEESIVIGDEIVFEQDSQNLTAAGHLETTFTLVTDGTATAEPPKQYHATAASMAYDDARHTATYRGNLAVLKEPDGETTAEVIVLSLASAGRSLERLEATGRVRSSLAGGRQALGDRLAYETAKDVYMLWGKPLTLWTKDDDGTCSSQTGNYVSFAGDTGAPNFPGTQNPGGAPLSSKQPCPAFLAPKK